MSDSDDFSAVGDEVEAALSKLGPGEMFDWKPHHPLDRTPDPNAEPGPLLDENGEPWSNL